MAVEGDLSSSTQLEVKKHGSLLLVDDIKFANFKLDGRSAATEHVPQYLPFCPRLLLFRMFRLSITDISLSTGHDFALACISVFCGVPHC